MNNQFTPYFETMNSLPKRTGLKRLEKQVVLPNSQLQFGKASDDGDCFFDSLAQCLNQLYDCDEYNVKILRQSCYNFYRKNKGLVDESNQKDRTNPLQEDEYYFIRYTQSELVADFNNRPPIWGRSNIEGVMLCSALDLPGICIIEILWDAEAHQPIAGYYLADKNGYRQISDEQEIVKLFHDNNLPKLAVGQKSLHFVPILPLSVANQAAHKTEHSQNVSRQVAREPTYSATPIQMSSESHNANKKPSLSTQANFFNKKHSPSQPSASLPKQTSTEARVKPNPMISEKMQAMPTEKTEIIARMKVAYKEYNNTADDYEEQLLGFKALGDYYVKEREFVDAIALYNFALAINQDTAKNENFKARVAVYQEIIVQQLKQAEGQFLQSIQAKETNPSAYSLDKAHQAYLQGIRDEARAKLARHETLVRMKELQLPATMERLEKHRRIEAVLEQHGLTVQQIYRTISEQMRHFVKVLIDECKHALGEPPCQYAIICFGSLARDEATPYSDLEFGILIEDTEAIFSQLGTQYYEVEGKSYAHQEAARLLSEQYKDYFRKLTKLLNIKVINLGETTPRMQNIVDLKELDLLERYSQSPIRHGFCFDGNNASGRKTPLGNRYFIDVPELEQYELILTPKQMAELHNETYYRLDRHLSTVLSTACLIDGDYSLLKTYKEHASNILNTKPSNEQNSSQWDTLVKDRAILLLYESIQQFGTRAGSVNQIGHFFNIKYDFYRLPNMLIDHLAMYYDLPASHFWGRVDQLFGKNGQFPNIAAANHLKMIISKVLCIRLKTYLDLGHRNDQILLSSDSIEKEFLGIDRNDLFDIYRTFLPFCEEVRKFLYQDTLPFNGDFYYSDHLLVDAQIHEKLLEFESAINKLLNLKANASVTEDKLNALIHLADIYLKQDNPPKAIKTCEEAIDIIDKNRVNLKTKDFDEGAIYNIKGLAHARLRKNKNVEIAFEKTKNCDKEQRGNVHKVIFYVEEATTLLNSGIAQQSFNFAKAESLFKRAEASYLKVLSPTHYFLASIYNAYGVLYTSRHQIKSASGNENYLDKAENYLNKAYLIRKIELGQAHPVTMEALFNLTLVCKLKGDEKSKQMKTIEAKKFYCEAEEKYKEAIELTKKHYTENHSDILTKYISLAALYRDMGKYDQAETSYKELLAKYQDKEYKNYYDIALIHNHLASIYYKAGKENEAIEKLKVAKKIALKHIDKDDVLRIDIDKGLLVLTALSRYPCCNLI